MLKIEKGVPVTDGRKAGKNRKYPWPLMEIGDSFLVEGVSRQAMTQTAKHQTETTGRRYKASKIDESHVRVWRVS